MRFFTPSTIKGKTTAGSKTNTTTTTTTTTGSAARGINGDKEANIFHRTGWLPKLLQKGNGLSKIEDNNTSKVEQNTITTPSVGSKNAFCNPLESELDSSSIPNILTEPTGDDNTTEEDSIENNDIVASCVDNIEPVVIGSSATEAPKQSTLEDTLAKPEPETNNVENNSRADSDYILPVNNSNAIDPLLVTTGGVTTNNRPMTRPPRQNSSASRIVKFTPPVMAKSSSVVLSPSTTATSPKPSTVLRAATENSSASLHRRQQPMIVFEFDTASLHRIVSDNGDNNEVTDRERTAVPMNLNLPKTMDATMRAVSAMTMSSLDDSDYNLVNDGDDNYDDDASIDIGYDNASIQNKLETSPTSTSPVSVVDNDVVAATAVTSETIGGETLPAWMQQWASLEASNNENKDGNSMALKEQIDFVPVDDMNVFECSATTASMQYSCSTSDSKSIETVISVSYIPTVPYPPCKDSMTTALPPQEYLFQGWVAASYGSSSDESITFNTDSAVGVSALRYIEILSTTLSMSSGTEFVVSLTDVNGTKSSINFSTNNAIVLVHSISARTGNCLEIVDEKNRLSILPVHVTKSMLRATDNNDDSQNNNTCCEKFFMPFKSKVVVVPTETTPVFYAPDAQIDAVLHLRFKLDAVLQQARALLY